MRRTLSAAVMFLAFCCPVSAGVIHNPPPEPTPRLEEAMLKTAEGEAFGAEADAGGGSFAIESAGVVRCVEAREPSKD
jgi:hypothetical protein